MSNFVVSALKYRPVRFDEVVGQEHVSGTLKNALQNDHLAHAFLFCGPRGVGKTTCARILAKVINCENVTSDHEACNECNSCKAFNENASFNITELDAASNNSVEHIRALIEQVRFQPQQGRYKVFIIDEVHMLSQQAFNAFLKTLEEPPPYAIFILATTEKHKIIPTILSRCQIFDFRRIQVPDMVNHLEDICKKEGIEADTSALHIIAQKADGALRDALSIFDRIVSSSGKKITYEDVIQNLNVLDYDYFFRILDGMLTEDMPNVMMIFDQVLRNGFEASIFINGLAEHLRNVLVCKDPQTLTLLEVSENLKERYQQQADIAPMSYLLTALNIANECDVDYKMARNKRLHVEMAIIKMTYIMRAVSLQTAAPPSATVMEKKITEVRTPSAVITPQKMAPPSVEEPLPSTTDQPKSAEPDPASTLADKITVPKIALSDDLNISKISSLEELDKEMEKDDKPTEETSPALTIENLNKAWKDFMDTVTSPSVKNTLKRTELSLNNKQVVARVGTKMAKSQIQEETELMPFVRRQLNESRLSLEIQIDPALMPKDVAPKPKALLSPKEKFDKMKEINPLIEDLQKRFGLQPDND